MLIGDCIEIWYWIVGDLCLKYFDVCEIMFDDFEGVFDVIFCGEN